MKIFSNPYLKLGSLILAFVIWLVVAITKDYTYQFSFPLKLVNLPSQYVIVDSLPKDISVTITGTGEALFRLILKPGKVIVDASGFKYGRRFHNISKDEIVIPKEKLKIVSINGPRKFSFLVDEVQQKTVPIVANLELIPKPGYFIRDKVELFPSDAILLGPKSLLNNVKEVITEVETLRDISGEVSFIVSLSQIDKRIKYSPSAVRVKLEARPASFRTIANIPVKLINSPENKKIILKPENITLQLIGLKEKLNAVDTNKIEPLLDYDKLNGNKGSPTVILPAGVRLFKMTPESIMVLGKQ